MLLKQGTMMPPSLLFLRIVLTIWCHICVLHIYFIYFSNQFLLEYSCFTMLYQFLLNRKVNHPYIYIYALHFGLPSHSGHHCALSRVPCIVEHVLIFQGASRVAQMVRKLPAMQKTGFSPWVGKIPWRREWLSNPVFLPG